MTVPRALRRPRRSGATRRAASRGELGRHRRRPGHGLRHARSPATARRPSTPCACGRRSATAEFDLSRVQPRRLHRRPSRARTDSENISQVLYPDDSTPPGRELRLQQEYFFVCATLQDIAPPLPARPHRLRRDLPDKVAIQLNDTHPALAVPELMRLLVDEHGLAWDDGLGRSPQDVFGYTNHTLLPEALETLAGRAVRAHAAAPPADHLRDQRALPGRGDAAARARRRACCAGCRSIDEAGERRVRMAHLAIVGSHSVNGVSALHSRAHEARRSSPTSTSCARSASTTRPTASRRAAGCAQANPPLAALHHRRASATAGRRDLDAARRRCAPLARRRRLSCDAFRARQAREQAAAGRTCDRRAPAASTSTPTRCSTCRSSASTSTSGSC